MHTFQRCRSQAQQKALATDGTEVQSYESAVGLAVLDYEGLFRIHARGRHILWIPDSDKQLQVRLMICAHMRDAGHRGVAATLVSVQEFCVWSGMEAQIREFVRQCLHCADKFSGGVVPRPLGEPVHGTAPNGPQASQGLSEDSGFRYILVIMDDLSKFVSMELSLIHI